MGSTLKMWKSEKVHASGFIVREENVVPSNFRSTNSLGEYLRAQKIVGIQEIDTRNADTHIAKSRFDEWYN